MSSKLGGLDLRTLRFLWTELRPHWKKLMAVAIAGLLMSGAQAEIAVQIKTLIDGVKDNDTFNRSCLVIFALTFVMALSRYFHFYLMNVTGEYVTQQLRAKLQRKFMRLSLSFHNSFGTGSGGLISRILNDVLILQSGLRLFADLFRSPFAFSFLFIWLLILNWKLTLSIIFVLPLVAGYMRVTARSVAKYSKRGFEGLEKITAVIKETLDGIRIIHSFNLEGEMERRFANEFDEYLNNKKNVHRRAESNGPVTEFIATALIIGIVYYARIQISHGYMSTGELASYFATLLMLNLPIKNMQDAFIRVQEALVCAGRIQTTLEEKSEVPQSHSTKDFPANWKKIEFANVSFSYGKGLVLKKLNFSIHRGEVVAFVGASGSGKSTIVNLLERFFDPLEGVIKFDELSINEIRLPELRRNIALVTQDVFLFGDSVERNIWSGDFAKGKEGIVECAKAANCYDFIQKLPEGFQTRMGERGNLFSGGEKQRISMARALFKNAPLLILDEATSALDSKSEAEVQKGLDHLMEGRTSLVIAHRLSTIAKADRIFVMKEGEIIEIGTHNQLLALKGEYYHLSQLQNLGENTL